MTPSLNQLLWQYSYLQLMDLLTTIAFLLRGVPEANPFVGWMLEAAPTPVAGLVLVKLIAMALGVVCWRLQRNRVLIRMNLLFAAVVAWNVVAIIRSSL